LQLLAAYGTIGVLAVVYVVMEIVVLFRAANVFQSKNFRHAGWGRIIAILSGIAGSVILIVLAVLAFASSYTPSAPVQDPSAQAAAVEFGRNLFLGFGVILVVWSIPDIFAYLGFNAIPHSQPTTPTIIGGDAQQMQES
jgi:hypothetical protein